MILTLSSRGGHYPVGISHVAGDSIVPAGWSLAPWWSETQLNNIHALLKFLKQTYRVDDNDVRLAGVSDGGIGSFFGEC